MKIKIKIFFLITYSPRPPPKKAKKFQESKQVFGWICFSFFKWHVNLHGLFNAKAILVEEQ